jgi:hypothetical protein
MMFLTLKDVITLKPGASHRLKRALWIDPQHNIDRSRLLKTKGQVYVVVGAFIPGIFAVPYRKAAEKLPLLRTQVKSNLIAVP